MINRNQNKVYNYGSNNQIRKNQYTQNQLMNQIQNKANNPFRKNMTPNTNLNNRILGYNRIQTKNQNNNNNNNINNNDDLSKAIFLISRECKKKDDRIKELEKKVVELTKKLNSLLNNNNISTENNTEYNMMENVREYSRGNEARDGGLINKIGKDFRGYSFGYVGTNNRNNQRSNSYMQSISQNNINYNSDTEKAIDARFTDNLSHSHERSVLTYNGGLQSSSKLEVKNYLKEVKLRIETKKFKEFIRNIKSLTAKNNSSLNKDVIVETIRKLFGEENEDLFIKFQNIIGIRK